MGHDPLPEGADLETLARHVAALASAVRPADVFRRLLDATRSFAPRTALFLHRDGRWQGWGASGYTGETLKRFRSLRADAEDGALERLSRSERPEGETLPPGVRLPDFGQPPAVETHGVPLRAGSRTIGLLVAERADGEEPWRPAALGVLAIGVRLRLELDLSLRKLRPAHPEERKEASAPAPADTPPAPVDPAETSMAPWLEPPGNRPDGRRQEEARRFARLVATDIRLYNEEAVLLGRRNRDLFRRLADPIEQGREAFDRRFAELGEPGKAVLHRAFVEILAGGDDDLLPLPHGDPEPRAPGLGD